VQTDTERSRTSSNPGGQVREHRGIRDEVLQYLQASQMLRSGRDSHTPGPVQVSRAVGSDRQKDDGD